MVLLLAACEAAVEPNDYRDYTPPRVVAMYPAEPVDVSVPTNASFYIQFDDRMDPAIAAFDSDALILEDLTTGIAERIPLTFQLVNADTCLLATFDPKQVEQYHFYRLRVSDTMRNYSRLALPETTLYSRSIMFQGYYPPTVPAFTLTSHTNNGWGGQKIRFSGTCTGIETITVSFEEYGSTTEQVFRLPYGTTDWSVTYLVDTSLIRPEKYTFKLTAAPYYSYRRLVQSVDLRMDLQLPLFMPLWPYTANLAVTNNACIRGIAGDNWQVAGVYVKLGDGAWQQATGTLEWSRTVTVSVTSNTPSILHLAALDQAGNSNYCAIPVILSNN